MKGKKMNNKDAKILELKGQILNCDVPFLDTIVEYLGKNKILYSDNYGVRSDEMDEKMEYLEAFMHLLYRGSKHSVGQYAENGFVRIVDYKGKTMKFTYYTGPETFIVVEDVDKAELDMAIMGKKVVTLELLKERLTEAENVKAELVPVIEKYLANGLTFEEITRMFVEIMRENRIKVD